MNQPVESCDASQLVAHSRVFYWKCATQIIERDCKEPRQNKLFLAAWADDVIPVPMGVDGAQRQRLYAVEGVIPSTGRELPPITVDGADFEAMKWVSQWGPEPNIVPGPKARDTLRHAIQSTASAAASERVFAHIGWVTGGTSPFYLHAAGAVGAAACTSSWTPGSKTTATRVGRRRAGSA